MKTYLAEIIPKIKNYSKKLDNLTLLKNQNWVVINELKNSKLVYIFRDNYELLISQNGKVVKGKWEYLGNNTLLIDSTEGSYLFKHGFFDENILALKVDDGKEEFVFLVNENKYEGDLNSIEKVLDFLEKKYLKKIPQKHIETTSSKQDNNTTIQIYRNIKYKEVDLLIVKRDIILKDKFGNEGNDIIHLKRGDIVKYIETIKIDRLYPWYLVETEKGERGYYVSLDFEKKV